VTNRYFQPHTEHPGRSYVGRTLEETAVIFHGEARVEYSPPRRKSCDDDGLPRPGELFDEIMSRLNAMEAFEKHPAGRRASSMSTSWVSDVRFLAEQKAVCAVHL
jgi:hypothetical protein